MWTDENDISCVHVFSADIPVQLLDMLDEPARAAPSLPPITIRHTTVPSAPRELHSRLLELIVPDWYEQKSRPEKKTKKKGKDGKEPVVKATTASELTDGAG